MIFTTTMTVRGHQCDAYGHVNNARWVELLEEARWRWLEAGGVDLRAWEEQRQGIAVAKLAVAYRRAAHPLDELEFRCWITRLGGRSACCRQEVFRAGTQEKMLEADLTFVLFDIVGGRARPMTGDVRDMFARYLHREEAR